MLIIYNELGNYYTIMVDGFVVTKNNFQTKSIEAQGGFCLGISFYNLQDHMPLL